MEYSWSISLMYFRMDSPAESKWGVKPQRGFPLDIQFLLEEKTKPVGCSFIPIGVYSTIPTGAN